MSYDTLSGTDGKKKITILGVTGSIGRNTVDVVNASSHLFNVHAVTANRNAKKLAEIAIKLGAKKAVIADSTYKEELETLLQDTPVTVQSGREAIIAALENKNNVAIANKEPLVAAGKMIMALAKAKGVNILPVDSEHNAIFQVLEENNKKQIDRLILTASGGPFLRWNKRDIQNATPEQAIAHPNWTMGAKISVDSATMMNKALEVIEAAHLFSMPPDKIEVVIHPQSTIHSIVSYKDGSMLAQMGASDMRTPIASALGWPKRLDKGGDILNLTALPSSLTFEKPDLEKFPSISYAYKCIELGQSACITLNAANEVAVARFLSGDIAFGDIMRCVSYSVNTFYPELDSEKRNNITLKTVEEIEKLDIIIRQATNKFIDESCIRN